MEASFHGGSFPPASASAHYAGSGGVAMKSNTASFELSVSAARVFARAVTSLSKIGQQAVLLFRSDGIVLHGADDAHSSAMQFAFRRRFFRSLPTSSVDADALINAKVLLGAFRCAQQRGGSIDGLLIGLAGSTTSTAEPRLILEFMVRYGGVVRHRVPLLDGIPFLPGEPNAGPNAVALAPSLLGRILEHCSHVRTGCDEITVAACPGEGLRMQSADIMAADGGQAQANRTEVLIQMSDLEACSLHGEATSQVTFSGRALRDFAKASEAWLRDLEQAGLFTGPPLLELRFGPECGSVVSRLSTVVDGVVQVPTDFTAVLIVATRDLDGDGKPQTGVTAAVSQPPATAPNRRPVARQTSSVKRRAVVCGVPLVPEAFECFPAHSSQSQAATQAQASLTPIRQNQPCLATPPRFDLQRETHPRPVGAQPTPQHHQVHSPQLRPVGAPSVAPATQPCISQPCLLQVSAPPLVQIAMQARDNSSPQPNSTISQWSQNPNASLGGYCAVPGFSQTAAASTVPGSMGPPAERPPPPMGPPVERPPPQLPPPSQNVAVFAVPVLGLTSPGIARPPQLLGDQGPRQSQPIPPGTLGFHHGPGQQDASAPGVQAQHWQQPPLQANEQVLGKSRPGVSTVTASSLAAALGEPDSDDELIGADPDEMEQDKGNAAEDSVDWFDVDNCAW